MLRRIGLTIVALTALAVQVEAARFTCKAAQELSRLGTHDSDTVEVDADDNARQCRFSINGEPAGSPPRDQLVQAINILRSGTGSATINAGDTQWLALLLLAASPEDAVPGDVSGLLSKYSAELTNCMAALEKSDLAFSFDIGDLFCKPIPAGGGDVSFAASHPVEVQSAGPYYVLGIRRNNSGTYLFIPLNAFKGAPLQ